MSEKPEPALTDGERPAATVAEEAPPSNLDEPAESAPIAEAEQPTPVAATDAVQEQSPPAHASEREASGARWGWVKYFERTFSFLANVAVIGGIWFAATQIRQADVTERRRVAIEAVGQTRSPEFLTAYRRLKDAYTSKQVELKDSELLLDSLNHVMNVYDNIAILYIYGVGDRCIIKAGVEAGAREMSPIARAYKYPDKYRDNFDSLLLLMEQEVCDRPTGGSP